MPDKPLFPGKKSMIGNYDRYDFPVADRPCIVVVPRTNAPGKPWIWRTEFFWHEPQTDLALLDLGFHVVYIDMQNHYGCPRAMQLMDVFYNFLTRDHGFAPKTVLEGFSRGGLFAFNWAARNPEKVTAIYADAPLCDFKTWPAKGSTNDWALLLKMYQMTEEQAMKSDCNPIDNLAPLAKAGVRLLHVVGDADDVVLVEGNTAIVERRYKELGGQIEVIHKPGVNHHPHSLKDPKPIVDFILKAVADAQ